MCLVLAFTSTKKINLSKCLNDIGNTLLKSEDDGFGYAIQGRGGVFGEKTISKRFRTRLARQNHVMLPIVKKRYMSFGVPTELVGPGVFHGRTATNCISLVDTHPMQMIGWHLIHNGVVTDLGPKYDKKTDNDSEDVLKRLLDGVGKPNPMIDIETYLEGYYAFAAIDPEGRLHVARDPYATLHIAYSAKYETFIIGTTESLILKVSKILDAKIGPIDEIEDETYCIFSGNELIHCQDFKTRGFSSRQAIHANASLGHALPEGSNNPIGLAPRDVGPHSEFKVVSTPRVKEFNERSEADWQAMARRENQGESTDDHWQDNIMDLLRQQTDKHPDRGGGRVSEDNYYKYKNEIDNMDASYQIYAVDDKPITLEEFKKMDYVSQETCTIIRGDGTVVDPEDYGTPRLRGRHNAD